MGTDSLTKTNDDQNLQTREETRASGKFIKPMATIIETDDGLTLIADLPGATKDTVDVNVDKGILTINAPVKHTMPGRSIYTEFELAHYYRQFAIPENLDHEKAKADFTNGLLTLKVPLLAAAKPRKIEIKAA